MSQFPVFTSYVQKNCLPSGPRCGKAAWSFERVLGHGIESDVRKRGQVGSRQECMELCLSETQFKCRWVSQLYPTSHVAFSLMTFSPPISFAWAVKGVIRPDFWQLQWQRCWGQWKYKTVEAINFPANFSRLIYEGVKLDGPGKIGQVWPESIEKEKACSGWPHGLIYKHGWLPILDMIGNPVVWSRRRWVWKRHFSSAKRQSRRAEDDERETASPRLLSLPPSWLMVDLVQSIDKERMKLRPVYQPTFLSPL